MEYSEVRRAGADSSIEDVDVERIRRVVDFTRSLTTGELLAEILPGGTPAHVASEIARNCRFAHGSVMVFPAGPLDAVADGLTGVGLSCGALRPSTVVREKIAREYGFSEAELQVQIVQAAISGEERSAGIEIFLCPVDSEGRFKGLVDDEREANRETHFALDVLTPEPQLMIRLWELLTGPAGMAPDGGGFNPHEGSAGRTVLYFRTEGMVAGQGMAAQAGTAH